MTVLSAIRVRLVAPLLRRIATTATRAANALDPPPPPAPKPFDANAAIAALRDFQRMTPLSRRGTTGPTVKPYKEGDQ
jgi:hypothetical protein